MRFFAVGRKNTLSPGTDAASVDTLRRPTELVGEQIAALQLGEHPRLLPLLTTQDAGYRDLSVEERTLRFILQPPSVPFN